jgi:hypothetical protein
LEDKALRAERAAQDSVALVVLADAGVVRAEASVEQVAPEVEAAVVYQAHRVAQAVDAAVKADAAVREAAPEAEVKLATPE